MTGKGDDVRLAKEGDRDAYLCFDPSRIPALKGEKGGPHRRSAHCTVYIYVRVCVCVCACACVRACAHVYTTHARDTARCAI